MLIDTKNLYFTSDTDKTLFLHRLAGVCNELDERLKTTEDALATLRGQQWRGAKELDI